MPAAHLKISVKPEEVSVFVGKYANPHLALTIRREGDHLAVQGNGEGPLLPFYPLGQAPWPFYCFAEGHFFNDQLGVELDFERSRTAMTIYQSGYMQRLNRQ